MTKYPTYLDGTVMPKPKTSSDRRPQLRAEAARVHNSMNPEFKELSADELMAFIRGADFAQLSGDGSSLDVDTPAKLENPEARN